MITGHSYFPPMSNLRRYYTPGNLYFVTHVTIDRMPILVQNADLLMIAFERALQRFDVEMLAWVILPDHLHLIVDPKMHDLSKVMKIIKQDFGLQYRQRIGVRTGRVWQLRFWDHIIRDQEDMNRHLDYIHYNPVKHGYAKAPADYAHSSFSQYVADGLYQKDWGTMDKIDVDGEFGE